MSRFDDTLQSIAEQNSYADFPSKSTIVEYAKEQYGADWRSQLAMRISGTNDKSSTAYRSAMRPFQGQREHQEPTARSAGKFQELAKQLQQENPIASLVTRVPTGPITIVIEGRQDNGRGGQRTRHIEVTLSGTTAYDFVNNPVMDYVWMEYFGVDDYEAFGDDLDLSSSIDVTSVA